MNASTSFFASRRWLLLSILILIATVTAWVALRSAKGEPPVATKVAVAVPATLVRVAQENVPNFLVGIGTVEAWATVTVKTRLDGQLERVDFVEGQDVKAGQVLAQIDAHALRAQLEQTQAQKSRDEAQLANVRLDLERYTGLIKEEAASQQMVDTQRALMAQMQAAVQSDEAQIHYAQVQLGYATITAPLAGRVGARLVDPGNIVHVTDANGLVVINQIDPIAVVFTVPGDAVQAINAASRPGHQLVVLVYARTGDSLLARGELVLMNNQIDVASGTVQLKARFANAAHALWPGQYVNVRLQLGEHIQALTVPATVVQRGPSGTYAYAVDADGKAQLRPIEVVQIQDGKAVIGKGLQVGETVVAEGQYKIKPGIAVVATPPAPDNAGAAAARGGNP